MLEAIQVEKGQARRLQVPFLNSPGMEMTTLGTWAQMRSQTFFEEASIFLAAGQRLLDTRPIVRTLWPGLQVSDRHAIFRFDVEGRVYLVPALFLIGRLFLTVRSVAKYLLQPGMFESFVDPAPVIEDDLVRIRLPPHLSVNQCSEGLARTMAWFAVDRSASKAWRSIWFKGVGGRIDLDLPTLTMSGRLGGVELDGMRLVTWSRELTFNTGLPNNLIVTSRRGNEKAFKRGGCV